MSLVKVATRWLSSFTHAPTEETNTAVEHALGREPYARGQRTAARFMLVLLPLLLALSILGHGYASANCSLSNASVTPELRKSGASVDGTSRTLFVFTVSVTVPDSEVINLDANGMPTNGTYVTMNGVPMRRIDGWANGGGVYRCTIPGYFFHPDDDRIPYSGPASINFYAYSKSTSGSTTQQVTLGYGSLWVTGCGREVLIPVDENGNSDQFKPAKKAGGVTVQPADPANYGDGSASATYTFRVKYIDPEGLPPRPWIPGNTYDQLGPGITDITSGVEMDQHNVPRRKDDPWRFPTPTDPTLPAGVAPAPYRSGVYIVFDDNNDGVIRPNPDVFSDPSLVYWNSAGEPTSLFNSTTGYDAPRFMVIDTDLQPQFKTSDPTAADWRNGVIFKYTVRANDHSVAVGVPNFFNFGTAVQQVAMTPFSDNPGQKYVNAGRTDDSGGTPFDPMARSFVSLPVGLRRYTYLTSNDVIWQSNNTGYPGVFGNWRYLDASGHWVDRTYPSSEDQVHYIVDRFFQQPRLNKPLIDPQSPPSRVFYPPFEIQVDPQITVEQAQLKSDINPQLMIGIPTAVHALRKDQTGATVDVPLFALDRQRSTPTRFTSTDDVQWRFYYTQSQGLAPTIAELYIFKQDTSGNFVAIPGSPFACKVLASGAAGRDPLYASTTDPSLTSAYYAQYGLTMPAGAAPLGAGVYRYYFRASDGRRTVEWPGDSGTQTSLTTQAKVSHIANTMRINTIPTLSNPVATPQVDAKTGAISWRIEVTYTDADNDAPGQPLLVFPDPNGDPAKALTLVMQKVDPTDNTYTDGVKYALTSATDPTVGAFAGRRQYKFVFNDNWKTANNPEYGETVTYPENDVLFLNSEPFLLNASLDKAQGALADTYTFSVTYGDNENDAPADTQDAAGNTVPDVRLYIDGKATDHYLRTADPAPNYSRGVVYSVQVSGQELGAGPHTFKIMATDAHGLAATAANGVGPSIYTPELSAPGLRGTSGVAGPPVVGYPQTGFIYQVLYKHLNGDLPQYVRVHILNPDGSELQTVDLTQQAGQTGTAKDPGLIYSNETAPFKFSATGSYQYYFEASDGQSKTTLKNGTENFQGPIVAGPTLTPQAVSPLQGVNSQPFTFRVIYTHPGAIQPAYVKLRLVSPSGAAVALPNDGAMSTTETVPGNIPNPGWIYSLGGVLLSEAGTYHYSFTTSDGSTTAETAVSDGPVSGNVEMPVLSNASVVPAPNSTTQVVYRVTYKQSQNLAPTDVTVVTSTGTQATMALENPADTDMTDGAVYAVTLDRPAGNIPSTYYFVAQGPGFRVQYPDNGAVGPNAIPVLSEAPNGSFTPASGNTSTKFTFQVLCKDVDATADPTVYVTVGNQRLSMKKVSGDVTQAGALYSVETNLPAGSMVYSFSASDGADTTRLPASGNFTGPTVLAATNLNAVLTPDTLTLDGVSKMSVTGVLSPVVGSADINLTFTPPIGAPSTQVVTTDAQGRFSATFVPNCSGQWTVKADYAGNGQSVGGGTQTLTATVTPGSFALPAGLNFIGTPVQPGIAGLDGILGGSNYQIARWNGASYDFGNGSMFSGLNPGMGFWVSNDANMQAQAVGMAVDHNQKYRVAVRPGWNQIANPYLVPISWNGVTFETGGTAMSLFAAKDAGLANDHAWTYDPISGQYVLVHSSVQGAMRDIGAWQGFWFRANANGFLIFDAPGTRAAASVETRAARKRSTDSQWTLQLMASNGKQRDAYNFAGVSSESRAADGDLESPPVLKKYVDLYFTRTGESKRYATDFRTPAAGEQVWDFVVETDMTDKPVTVSAPNLSEVPKNLEVLLEDVDAGGRSVYLRTSGGYTFNPGKAASRRFQLIVRPRSEGTLRISDITVADTRGGRAISYALSRDASVTVEVMSPSGKRLKLVADRQASAQGRSSVAWDGTREDGVRLPAGVYLIQLTATMPDGQSARSIKPIVVTR